MDQWRAGAATLSIVLVAVGLCGCRRLSGLVVIVIAVRVGVAGRQLGGRVPLSRWHLAGFLRCQSEPAC